MDSDRADPSRVLEHAAWARRVARAMVRDEHLADDLAQDALEAVLRRTAEPTDGFRAWIRGALRNLRAQAARTEQRRSERELRAGTGATPPIPPDELLARIEAHRSVADAVLKLPEPSRSALTLRYYEDLPMREVARVLGISEQAAASRIHRGLQELREAYRQRMGSDWSAALLPLLTVPAGSVPATFAGVTIMTMKTKLTVAGACALALLAAYGGMLWLSEDSTPGHAPALAAAGRAGESVASERVVPLPEPDSVPAAAAAEIERSTVPSGWRLRVVDESGGVVPDAEVAVYGLRGGAPELLDAYSGTVEQQHGHREPDLLARTDAAGEAVFQPRDQKLAGLIYVRAAGFVWQAFRLPAAALPDRDLGELVLTRGGFLALRVRDGDGRPLVGLHMFWLSARLRGSPGAQQRQRAITDEQGLARFESLPLGPGMSVLGSPGYLHWQESDLQVASAPEAPIEVVLDRGGVVEVIVQDADGQEVPGAELFIHSFARWGPATSLSRNHSEFYGLTDEQGRASVGGLQEKRRQLLLARSGASWTEQAIRATEEPIVLRLPALHEIRARFVRPDGVPLAGATALLMDASRPTYAPEYAQELGADGVLAMSLPAGSFAWAIRHPEGSRILEEFTLTRDMDLGEVVVPEGPLLVLDLRDAANGEPVEEAKVRFVPAPVHFSQQEVPWREPLLETLWHDSCYEVAVGAVRCRQLYAGTHALEVTAPGFIREELEVHLQDGITTERRVDLRSGTRLDLTILYPDGQPMVGEAVAIVGDPPDLPGREPHGGITDDSGRVSFEGLQPGSWRLGFADRVQAGQAWTTLELEQGRNRRQWIAPKPVAVLVELLAAGKPVAEARVEFRRESAASRDGYENGGYSFETDALGRARFDCKEPGSHQVRAFAAGLLPQQQEVRIEGVETASRNGTFAAT